MIMTHPGFLQVGTELQERRGPPVVVRGDIKMSRAIEVAERDLMDEISGVEIERPVGEMPIEFRGRLKGIGDHLAIAASTVETVLAPIGADIKENHSVTSGVTILNAYSPVRR